MDVPDTAPQNRSVEPAPVQRGFRRLTVEDTFETRWVLVGPHGAMDFHCTNVSVVRAYGFDRCGGLETHYRTPPDYMRDREPSHEHCWMLGGKCWHDGSSLYASEVLIPLLERDGVEAIWRQLDREYVERFGDTKQAPQDDPMERSPGTEPPITTSETT